METTIMGYIGIVQTVSRAGFILWGSFGNVLGSLEPFLGVWGLSWVPGIWGSGFRVYTRHGFRV